MICRMNQGDVTKKVAERAGEAEYRVVMWRNMLTEWRE